MYKRNLNIRKVKSFVTNKNAYLGRKTSYKGVKVKKCVIVRYGLG